MYKLKKFFRTELDTYVKSFFPCTCAGYFSDYNKIDPDCHVCNNMPRYIKMVSQLRSSCMLESYYFNKSNPDNPTAIVNLAKEEKVWNLGNRGMELYYRDYFEESKSKLVDTL